MSNQLIKCKACGNDIAVTANQCPKCGGVNDYVHPQIERFLKDGSNAISTLCEYKCNRFNILFYVRDKAPWWYVQWHLKSYFISWVMIIIMNFMPWKYLLGFGFGSLIGILLEISFYVVMIALAIGFFKWAITLPNTDTGISGPQKLYLIDFTNEKPVINTNDLEYWKEVDNFFKNDSEKLEPIAS